ncbi:hypothetical protein QBC32DRAFT_269450 [Pseudoneurospora amorphoporcata]|uniref:Uncharacterized protein n=1 Tax=Pseudoneurospora amorphoporcata TaxID=241081 RepID=A0AAN6SBH8_9PEZI|nr:hypothetical protein QBC32DRAFT_269450 [Pseudoneurospora amorphoporcata]
MADKDKDKQYKYRQEIQQHTLPLRRSTRIQRSQSARPSQSPQQSRKPKRTISASNPNPQTSRGRPLTRSSGPRPQQVSTLESQLSPSETPTRRVSKETTSKDNMDNSTNSPGESSQALPADTATHSGAGIATTSKQPPQDLEPLRYRPPVSDSSPALSVFQHSCGPDMEDQPLSVPSSVSMPISKGPDSLPRADVS